MSDFGNRGPKYGKFGGDNAVYFNMDAEVFQMMERVRGVLHWSRRQFMEVAAVHLIDACNEQLVTSCKELDDEIDELSKKMDAAKARREELIGKRVSQIEYTNVDLGDFLFKEAMEYLKEKNRGFYSQKPVTKTATK